MLFILQYLLSPYKINISLKVEEFDQNVPKRSEAWLYIGNVQVRTLVPICWWHMLLRHRSWLQGMEDLFSTQKWFVHNLCKWFVYDLCKWFVYDLCKWFVAANREIFAVHSRAWFSWSQPHRTDRSALRGWCHSSSQGHLVQKWNSPNRRTMQKHGDWQFWNPASNRRFPPGRCRRLHSVHIEWVWRHRVDCQCARRVWTPDVCPAVEGPRSLVQLHCLPDLHCSWVSWTFRHVAGFWSRDPALEEVLHVEGWWGSHTDLERNTTGGHKGTAFVQGQERRGCGGDPSKIGASRWASRCSSSIIVQ